MFVWFFVLFCFVLSGNMINMLASVAEEERTNELKLTRIHVFTCSQVLKVISEGERIILCILM